MAKEWAVHRNSKVLRMAHGITRKDASVSGVDATRVNVECTEDWHGESETGKVPEDTGLCVLSSMGDRNVHQRIEVEASPTVMIRHTSQVIGEYTL